MRAVSLFSGAGGMDIGFTRAGFDVVLANEIDRHAAETYRRNIDSPIHEGCVRTLPIPDVPVDCVFGGPPCQGFSVGGRMDPTDPRSSMVFEFVRVVDLTRPRSFVMENVANLFESPKFEGVVRDIESATRSMGYSTKRRILLGTDHGVPQRRRRAFLIGLLDGEHIDPKHTRPDTLTDTLTPVVGTGLPVLAKITQCTNPVVRKTPYGGFLFNGRGRPLNLDVPSPTLVASMGGAMTPMMDVKYLLEGGKQWFDEAYPELITGSPVDIPDHVRRLTTGELAAIQTFPPDHDFEGGTSSTCRQIGNAVPPNMAQAMAEAVRDSLDGKSPPTPMAEF